MGLVTLNAPCTRLVRFIPRVSGTLDTFWNHSLFL